MTLHDAWDDFYTRVDADLKPGGHFSGRIPNDIKQADYHRHGKMKGKNLGPKRAQKLFDRYYPGEYEIVVAVQKTEKEAP